MAVYTNKEEKKKDQSLKNVLIVMGILVLFFFVGYAIGVHFMPKEVEDEIIEDVETEYEVDDPIVVNLMSTLISGDDCWSIETYANDHKVSVKDIPSDRLYKVVELNSFYSKGIEAMSIEDFDTEIQNYFSIGYHFDPDSIDYSGAGCFQYSYDSDTQTFTKQENECEAVCGPNRTQYIITRAVEKDLTLNIYIKVLFGSQAESTNFYKDYERLEFITNDYENIADYMYKGEDYIFTFQKVNDRYLYVSSEIM